MTGTAKLMPPRAARGVMAAASQPCAWCGAALPLAQMVQVDQEGEWVYLCQGCAVAIPAERRRPAPAGGRR
jgi:hypothetical protein